MPSKKKRSNRNSPLRSHDSASQGSASHNANLEDANSEGVHQDSSAPTLDSNLPQSPTFDTTYISLAIFVHLFCVFVVLSSNFSPSELQNRLVKVVSPYTKTLHLDPNFVPFHLMSSEGEQRLHQWLVTTSDGSTYRFPNSQYRGFFPSDRQDMLGRVGASYAAADVDEVPAEIAKSLAAHVIKLRPTASDGMPLHVRCVQHVGELDPLTFVMEDIGDGINLVYEADVWSSRDRLNVLKRSPASQSAPPLVKTNGTKQ